jgi:hypothetical protein
MLYDHGVLGAEGQMGSAEAGCGCGPGCPTCEHSHDAGLAGGVLLSASDGGKGQPVFELAGGGIPGYSGPAGSMGPGRWSGPIGGSAPGPWTGPVGGGGGGSQQVGASQRVRLGPWVLAPRGLGPVLLGPPRLKADGTIATTSWLPGAQTSLDLPSAGGGGRGGQPDVVSERFNLFAKQTLSDDGCVLTYKLCFDIDHHRSSIGQASGQALANATNALKQALARMSVPMTCKCKDIKIEKERPSPDRNAKQRKDFNGEKKCAVYLDLSIVPGDAGCATVAFYGGGKGGPGWNNLLHEFPDLWPPSNAYANPNDRPRALHVTTVSSSNGEPVIVLSVDPSQGPSSIGGQPSDQLVLDYMHEIGHAIGMDLGLDCFFNKGQKAAEPHSLRGNSIMAQPPTNTAALFHIPPEDQCCLVAGMKKLNPKFCQFTKCCLGDDPTSASPSGGSPAGSGSGGSTGGGGKNAGQGGFTPSTGAMAHHHTDSVSSGSTGGGDKKDGEGGTTPSTGAMAHHHTDSSPGPE